MRYSSSAVSALALATAVLAQDPITIHVGQDSSGQKALAFNPSSVKAPNGTVVTFVFDTPGTNHTVAQSAFASPCAPFAGGFDSGYTPGPANAGDPPATWNLTVTNDAKPIWFYCAQAATTPVHCTAGMVGAINAPDAPAPNDFDAFQSAAKAAPTVSQPVPALTGVGAFASAAPTILVSSGATTTTATATTTSSAPGSASPPPTTTQGSTDTTAPPSAGTTTTSTDGGQAVTTTTSASSGTSSSAAPASTSNAAVAGAVGTSGLVWALAGVFGAALL